jgi:hypothetical protein
MTLEVTGKIWYWRGPAPWFFVTVPKEQSDQLKTMSSAVTYGWGMIPVKARINNTEWQTSLFPKDGLYVIPIKTTVRKTENLDLDDIVKVELEICP